MQACYADLALSRSTVQTYLHRAVDYVRRERGVKLRREAPVLRDEHDVLTVSATTRIGAGHG